MTPDADDPNHVPESFPSREAEAAFWDETDLTTLAPGELSEEPRLDGGDAKPRR